MFISSKKILQSRNPMIVSTWTEDYVPFLYLSFFEVKRTEVLYRFRVRRGGRDLLIIELH